MERNERRRGITALVRTLFRDSDLFPTLPDVATGLDIHPRTLRRRLTQEGTSFRTLRNEARSTEEESTGLRYTEVSTFSHAFKRW